jgi:Holliday junction resolvasome RuvABC DNA-binding subunit
VIASLRGRLLERSAGSCVIEAGGVGYFVELVGLGYSAAQAQDAIRRAAEAAKPDASLEDLVRGALARLTKAAAASAR